MKMFSESIFKIKTAKGEYPVLGQSYGDGLLGVHGHLEKFHVTHIPTGLRIASFPSLQQAKAFIVDVGDMDWQKVGENGTENEVFARRVTKAFEKRAGK